MKQGTEMTRRTEEDDEETWCGEKIRKTVWERIRKTDKQMRKMRTAREMIRITNGDMKRRTAKEMKRLQ